MLPACRKGKFGEELRDCDVRMDCVLPCGYRLGAQVHNRRRMFLRSDPRADQRLLDVASCQLVREARRRWYDERRSSCTRRCCGTRRSKGSRRWRRRRFRRAVSGWETGKARASDAAGTAYLDLAVKLGGLAPRSMAKSRRWGTEVYWAHRLRDRGARRAGDDARRRRTTTRRSGFGDVAAAAAAAARRLGAARPRSSRAATTRTQAARTTTRTTRERAAGAAEK